MENDNLLKELEKANNVIIQLEEYAIELNDIKSEMLEVTGVKLDMEAKPSTFNLIAGIIASIFILITSRN